MTNSKADKPRILLIDIETAPGKAFVWNLWDDRVPLERLIEPGRMLCAAFKWVGEKDVTFVAEWQPGGRRTMLATIRDALNEADAVVTYNGDHFDFKKLRGEFVLHRIKPSAKITSIDLYKTVKDLGFMSGKLEYVAPLLEIGRKVKHEGFKLWRLVLDGDVKARGRMQRYNVQDTKLLEKGYKRLAPYISNHPHLHKKGPYSCPVCGSKHNHHRGYYYTASTKTERLECQACGKWYTGKRSKIT